MYYKHKKAVDKRNIYAILDTEDNTFWFSGMNRAAYSSSGVAKTAFSSSSKNPLRCKYDEQTRFKIVCLSISEAEEGFDFTVDFEGEKE